MKRKNMAAMVTSIALVGAVAVGGTLALLTAESNTVTNTFAVGANYPENALQLREHDVNREADGDYVSKGGDYWKTEGADYIGIEYTDLWKENTLDKDPQFILNAGSADSWIVASITGMDVDEDTQAPVNTVGGGVLEVSKLSSEVGLSDAVWYKYDVDAAKKPGATFETAFTAVTQPAQITNGLYIYKEKVSAGESTAALFTQMKVNGSETAITIDDNVNMTIQGVAVAALADDQYDTLQEAAFSAIEAANGVLHPSAD